MLFLSTLETSRRQGFRLSFSLQFQFRVCQPPNRPQEHFFGHVWKAADANKSAATQDGGGDEVDACALCCKKHTTTFCGECTENYCLNVLTHTRVEKLFIRHNTCHVRRGNSQIWSLCCVLEREGFGVKSGLSPRGW